MNEADTTWWAHLWGEIEHWAFLVVVVALAIEFIALKLGEPYKARLDHLREEKIAAANERGSQAEKAAAEAKLELAKLTLPPKIDMQKFEAALKGKPARTVEVWVVQHDHASEWLGRPLLLPLQEAGWNATLHFLEEGDTAAASKVCGYPSGITLVVTDPYFAPPEFMTLDAALRPSVTGQYNTNGCKDLPAGVARIVIARTLLK